MNKSKSTFIMVKEELDQNDYDSINRLRDICNEKEPTTFKMELDYKISRVDENSVILNHLNEFMYFVQGDLIGYIGICQFGGDTLEVNGMVHPDYRRKGVFKKLFSLVKEEWEKRASKKILLLSDHQSKSGQQFIKHTNASHEHSEYDMCLKSDAVLDLTRNNLNLRRATNEDAKEIAWQNSIYFEFEFREEDITLPEDEEKHGEFIYMAEFEGTIVGKVHLNITDGIGSICGLGVLSEHRSKGYGREILTKAIQLLKKENLKDIVLQVATKNKNALTLYQSCGFEETTIMDYYELIK